MSQAAGDMPLQSELRSSGIVQMHQAGTAYEQLKQSVCVHCIDVSNCYKHRCDTTPYSQEHSQDGQLVLYSSLQYLLLEAGVCILDLISGRLAISCMLLAAQPPINKVSAFLCNLHRQFLQGRRFAWGQAPPVAQHSMWLGQEGCQSASIHTSYSFTGGQTSLLL